jgi:hypothetical protein
VVSIVALVLHPAVGAMIPIPLGHLSRRTNRGVRYRTDGSVGIGAAAIPKVAANAGVMSRGRFTTGSESPILARPRRRTPPG